MQYKERVVSDRLVRLADRFAVVVLCGARQVGKSTLLRHLFPDRPMVVFDPTVDVGNARADPDLFLDNHPPPIILDEIQYAPELVAAIKRRVDRAPSPGMYLLTGSQQWSVLKTASESLAGRAVLMDLEGFCLSEIANQPTTDSWLVRYLDAPTSLLQAPPARLPLSRSVYEHLWRGSMPEVDAMEDTWVSPYHRAYLRTYIERDVRLLSDVSDWQQFGRFVALAGALSAQEVNHAQLGREISVTPQTASRWLAVLRATFQWFELPAYHGNTIKRISGKPKGYLADTGLACAMQAISSPRALGGHPMTGAMFETAVVAELRKLAAVMPTPPTIHHWRSHGGAEVDVLLERDGRFYPIEVKLSSAPRPADTRGLKAFRATYPHLDVAAGLVICPCEQAHRLSDHDIALPWDSR